MADQPDLSRELARMESEPLLDVEKRLIGGSLILGVVLLVLLAWLASWFDAGA